MERRCGLCSESLVTLKGEREGDTGRGDSVSVCLCACVLRGLCEVETRQRITDREGRENRKR